MADRLSIPPTASAADRRASSPAPPTAADAAGARTRRLAALPVFLGTVALLGVAAWLSPSSGADQMGTHTQLSLPPCGWPMMVGFPCPSCGMTTSFAHAAEGNMIGSLRAQPMGFLLALLTAMAAVVAGWTLVTGSNIAGLVLRPFDRRAWWILGALALGAWVYKILVFRGVL